MNHGRKRKKRKTGKAASPFFSGITIDEINPTLEYDAHKKAAVTIPILAIIGRKLPTKMFRADAILSGKRQYPRTHTD